MQTQDKASKIFKNRDQLIAPHWLKFIDEVRLYYPNPNVFQLKRLTSLQPVIIIRLDQKKKKNLGNP